MRKAAKILTLMGVFVFLSFACYGDELRVLIIYDSGDENLRIVPDYRYISVHATTLPTPYPVNVREIARKLAYELRKKDKISTIYGHISDIERPDEILRFDLICIGSPTYFSNMSWQVKKFFDYVFSRYYYNREDKLNDRSFSCFTMAADGDSAIACLNIMEKGIKSVSQSIVPGMAALEGMNEAELEEKIKVYAERLANALDTIQK